MVRPQYFENDPTLDDGQFSNLRVDAAGRLLVTDSAGGSSASATGSTDDGPWNGTDPDATVISLLKAMYLKLVEIEENTNVV